MLSYRNHLTFFFVLGQQNYELLIETLHPFGTFIKVLCRVLMQRCNVVLTLINYSASCTINAAFGLSTLIQNNNNGIQ